MFLPADATALHLADAPLRQVLRLFAPEAPLHVRALGDVWHPSAGYVEEALVAGATRVADLLAFPYDFTGLVHLEAAIAEVTLTYHDGRYQLAGPLKTLQRLLARLRALAALPDAPLLQVL